MLRLKLFGTASVVAAGGQVMGRAAQGRRLALLAVLALARGRSVTRDKLIALLWPESPTDRARHQLSDDVYIVRGGLGEDVVRSIGDELALNPASITSDVESFEQSLDEGRHEQAVELFAGPLLDGFHLSEASEFERWLDGERARLSQRYAGALEALAEASEARGQFAESVQWWRRLAGTDPYNGRVSLRLMRALEAAGDRAGAIRHARIHATLLREEFDAAPDPEVTAFAERLRLEPPARPTKTPVVEPASGTHSEPEPAPPPVMPSSPTRSSRWGGRRYTAAAVVLFAIIAFGVAGAFSSRAPQGAAPGKPALAAPSVAVLPFVNMSADPENAYFSDGLSEQIIAALSRIEGLRVAARTSSFALRDGRLDVRAIGAALGVTTVLEGSVRGQGNRMRITAQLIDAGSGYHLWTEEYDRRLEDIFSVQEEIARSIAGALELRLARQGEPVSVRRVPDLEAYDLYLRGLFLRNSLTADALRQACDYFDRAIEREPEFALAYAGKASVVAPLILFGHIEREAGTRDFRALTARALELDPMLGEAHVALGILRLFFEWDWAGAERSLRRAIELNPNDAHAFHHLANYLRAMGRFDEAVAARQRAVDLDPLNARTIILLGIDHHVAGNRERAITEFRRARKLDPVHPLFLGSGPWMPAGPAVVYHEEGRLTEAVEEYVRLASLRGAADAELDALRRAYATAGITGFWREWLAMDLRQSGEERDALRMAKLWTLAGDTTEALRWLDSAYTERNLGLLFLNTDRTLGRLRSHPRMERILREMSFPAR